LSDYYHIWTFNPESPLCEVIELLIYDNETQRFELRLLPHSTAPRVVGFFAKLNQRIASGEWYGVEASGEWFPLLQSLVSSQVPS